LSLVVIFTIALILVGVGADEVDYYGYSLVVADEIMLGEGRVIRES